jgi:glucose-6-phosphate isomerase
VRTIIHMARSKHRFVNDSDGFNYSTTRMINKYLAGKAVLLYPEPKDVFPADLLHDE